jgi:transposase-like protein
MKENNISELPREFGVAGLPMHKWRKEFEEFG